MYQFYKRSGLNSEQSLLIINQKLATDIHHEYGRKFKCASKV